MQHNSVVALNENENPLKPKAAPTVFTGNLWDLLTKPGQERVCSIITVFIEPENATAVGWKSGSGSRAHICLILPSILVPYRLTVISNILKVVDELAVHWVVMLSDLTHNNKYYCYYYFLILGKCNQEEVSFVFTQLSPNVRHKNLVKLTMKTDCSIKWHLKVIQGQAF